LCKFYITIVFCFYDICNSTDILYIILSGSHSQYLAKITHLVQSGYVDLVQDVISAIVCFFVYHTFSQSIHGQNHRI